MTELPEGGIRTVKYVFDRNCPFDRAARIQMVLEPVVSSAKYMNMIRSFAVSANSLAIWYMGQNGFILKSEDGFLIGVDLYLSNSCARTFAHLPYRLDRQLPVFIEPEDLELDVFVTTHSHDDHADPETIRRISKTGRTQFVGPFDSLRVFGQCGVPESHRQLIHPGQTIQLSSSVALQATFALPTDGTDLNHTGLLLRFRNGITFYNTGDTAYAEVLRSLLPQDVDICAICINGGFHNLSPSEAASIVRQVNPRVAIPCHYDMLINNVVSPEMFRVALELIGSPAQFVMLNYYEPWLYGRSNKTAAEAVNG
jgi:L-ascorbate 6-phosphate lactonase